MIGVWALDQLMGRLVNPYIYRILVLSGINVILALSDSYLIAAAGRLIGGLTHGFFWAMLAGYAARLPAAEPAEGDAGKRDPELEALRQRLLASALLTVPVVLMAMVPAFQVDGWQWLSLTLAAPVVVWGGWPFHRAALVNLRHGSTTMDTLVSMGVLAFVMRKG